MTEQEELQAYRLARKQGAAQTIDALREQIRLLREGQLRLADFAGPAGSAGLRSKEQAIADLEHEIGQLELVASGEELGEERIAKLASLQVAPQSPARPSPLAERTEPTLS